MISYEDAVKWDVDMIRQVAALLRRALAVIVELKWQQQLTVIPCHPVTRQK